MFHYLIECKKYKVQRERMLMKLGRGARSMSTLLSNEVAIPQLLQFISETGRFKDNREDFNLTQKETERWRKSRERKSKKKGKRT